MNTLDTETVSGFKPDSFQSSYKSNESHEHNDQVPSLLDSSSAVNSAADISKTDISRHGQLVSETGTRSTQFKQSSNASIEIVTQDGDRVSLSYSALIQSSSQQSFSKDAQQSTYAYASREASSVSFQFKVQGSLDAGEQQAIDALLIEIGDIASQFFDGDVQAAFNSALELGFDGSELKSLAVDLQQNTQAKYSESYQRTEQLIDPLVSQLPKPNPGPAINLLSQLEELLDHVQGSELLENSEDTVKSMLDDMLEMLGDEFEFPIKDYVKDLISQF